MDEVDVTLVAGEATDKANQVTCLGKGPARLATVKLGVPYRITASALGVKQVTRLDPVTFTQKHFETPDLEPISVWVDLEPANETQPLPIPPEPVWGWLALDEGERPPTPEPEPEPILDEWGSARVRVRVEDATDPGFDPIPMTGVRILVNGKPEGESRGPEAITAKVRPPRGGRLGVVASADYPGFCVVDLGSRATVEDGGIVDVVVRLRRTVIMVTVVRADDESKALLGDVTLELKPVGGGAPLPAPPPRGKGFDDDALYFDVHHAQAAFDSAVRRRTRDGRKTTLEAARNFLGARREGRL